MMTIQTYILPFKRIMEARNLCYLAVIVNVFLGSCTFPKTKGEPEESNQGSISVSREDQLWMEKFFRDFFLSGSAIYTLYGTKPLSFSCIVHATEEEWKKAALPYIDEAAPEEKEKFLLKLSKECKEYDFAQNWDKWISFIENYPNSPFIFVKIPTHTDKLWLGHILNVQEMVWTLQKYYELFKKELGDDFDPISVTMDFKNLNSLFWKKVFSNHLLMGIVYGYGYKNSYFFNLYKNQPKLSEDHSLFFSLIDKTEHDDNHLSIKNLPLPRFRSFRLPFNNDPIREKYKLERENIQSNLTDENFFQKTLNQLTGRF